MNAVCNKMRMTLSTRRCTDRWSEYTSYSQYTALIESILVLLRVLAIHAAPVLAVTTGRNTGSTWRYPQDRSPKYLKYSCIPQAEYSTVVVNAEILGLWHYPQYPISRNKYCEYLRYLKYFVRKKNLHSHVLGAFMKAFIHG